MIRFTDTLGPTLLAASLAFTGWLTGCTGQPDTTLAVATLPVIANPPQPAPSAPAQSFTGFDRNTYPGDDRLAELHQHFAFTSFWLNNPPGEQTNTWSGHRQRLRDAGFGFVVLFNGRLDAEILHAHTTPEALGRADAATAIAAAHHEGFPDGTLIFLDQEEGGRLLPEQSAYFFAFTQAIAASPYQPGAYLSGQPSDDGPANASGTNGKRIMVTTAQDVTETVAAKHYHPVALWVAQDACPPAPGCTVAPAAVSHLGPRDSGTLDAIVWQYAQSPGRPELTRSCAKTYARDGNCYAGLTRDLYLDLNLASSPDPSHGR